MVLVPCIYGGPFLDLFHLFCRSTHRASGQDMDQARDKAVKAQLMLSEVGEMKCRWVSPPISAKHNEFIV